MNWYVNWQIVVWGVFWVLLAAWVIRCDLRRFDREVERWKQNRTDWTRREL